MHDGKFTIINMAVDCSDLKIYEVSECSEIPICIQCMLTFGGRLSKC